MRKSFTRLFGVFILLSMLSFQVVAVKPQVIGLDPANGSCTTEVRTDSSIFTMEFDQDVYPGALGTFALNNNNATQYVPIQLPSNVAGQMEFSGTDNNGVAWKITFEGSTVTLVLLAYPLEYETAYYLTVSENAIKNINGETFAGIKGTGAIANTCTDSPNHDWDFTTVYEKAFAVETTSPVKNTKANLTSVGSCSGTAFYVQFTQNIFWVEDDVPGENPGDVNPHVGYTMAKDKYKDIKNYPGYFALYERTDENDDVYGGDVVAHQPCSVWISDEKLYFQFEDDAYPLKPATWYYLRVREGLIEDMYGEVWDGFNTNDDWYFQTGDATPYTVNFAWDMTGGCPEDGDKIEITLTDAGGEDISLVDTSSTVWAESSISKTNIVPFISVTENGVDVPFTVSSVNDGGSVVKIYVSITGGNKHMAEYVPTIKFSDGAKIIMDESENWRTAPVSVSPALEAGDYQVDIDTIYATNADGTTFDIYADLGEVGKVYYVVAKTENANAGGDNRDPLNLSEIVNNSTFDEYRWKTSGTEQYVDIEAYGVIDCVNPDYVYHERIAGLDTTHGTDYDIFYFVADESGCGDDNNTDVVPDNYNTSSMMEINIATLDILPPEVVAKQANDDDDYIPGDDDENLVGPICARDIYRWGPIVITMNEPVRNVDGTPIEVADIADIFSIYRADGSTYPEVGIFQYDIQTNTASDKCSYYDPVNYKFYIFPTEAFRSNDKIDIFINANTIEDDVVVGEERFGPRGTELLVEGISEAGFENCYNIEAYEGPMAYCTDWYPADGASKVVDDDRRIVLAYDQKLYAPVLDEDPVGVLTEISNTVGDDTWIGKYIRIRKASTENAVVQGGVPIYSGDPTDPGTWEDGFSFNITYPSYGTKIEITWDEDYTLESEMFYYVELESGLQSKDRYDLVWDGDFIYDTSTSTSDPDNGDYSPATSVAADDTDEDLTYRARTCAPYNYKMVFQAEDNIAPTCIFYEDNNDVARDGHVQMLPEGSTTMVDDSMYIKVSINEWVQLGFPAEFTDLEPTDTIEDANALRPYFTLTADGVPVSFDCMNFSIDFAGDEATLTINPYGHAEADFLDTLPNWKEDVTYEVCFLGGAASEGYTGDDDFIFEDDNENGVAATCSQFEVYVPDAEVPCTIAYSPLGTEELDTIEVGSEGGEFVFSVNFSKAMQIVSGAEAFEMYLVNADSAEVLTDPVALADAVATNDNKTWTWTLPRTEATWYDQVTVGLVTNSDWSVIGDSVMFAFSDPDCNWGGFVGDSATIETWTTKDLTGPSIVSFNIDSDVYGCLAERDAEKLIIEWDENVVAANNDGYVEIRRIEGSGNTNIKSVHISNISFENNFMKINQGKLYDVPNTTEICDELEYGQSYFVHVPDGLVKDASNNVNAEYTGDTELTFCVGADPNPQLSACPAGLKPWGEIQDDLPEISIKFQEPVIPVAGNDIQIHEGGETSAIINLDVSMMSPVGTTFTVDGKVYAQEWKVSIEDNLANINATNGDANFTGFVWDTRYDVNLDDAAFVDFAGLGSAPIVTYPSTSAVGCQWWFILDDTTGPTVKLWPNDDDENIPVNAHLYAYINDVPWVYINADTIWPLVTDGQPLAEAKQFFTLSVENACGNAVTPRTLDEDEWTLEFVGDDKQHLRITVYDQYGYDFDQDGTTDDHPVMQAQALYTLAFDSLSRTNSVDGIYLCDSYGNGATPDYVEFYTEDVTAPYIKDVAYTSCGASADEIKFDVFMRDTVCHDWEAGTFMYEVWQDARNKKLVEGTETVTNGNGHSVVATGIEAALEALLDGKTDVVPEDYNVYVKIKKMTDTGVDRLVGDAIYDEWPFDVNAEGYFDGEEISRVEDLIKSPVVSESIYIDADMCKVCDNDAPVLVSTYPDFGNLKEDEFPIADSLVMTFNEAISLNDNPEAGQGWSIWVRDLTNNLGVPLAYDVDETKGNRVVTLYPIDSSKVDKSDALNAQFIDVADLTDLSAVRADLKSQHKYYVELDRYTISDSSGCNGPNYKDEIVGDTAWVFETADVIAPCLVSVAPMGSCVDSLADIVLEIREPNGLNYIASSLADSNFLYIYREDGITPHETIPLSSFDTVYNAADSIWTVTISTAYQFLSDSTYVVTIPGTATTSAGTPRFKDNYGNIVDWSCEATGVTVNEITGTLSWKFTARDYTAPLASSVVFEDLSYLDVVLRDEEYSATEYINNRGLITVGDETNQFGETTADEGPIATSSYVKIKFDEVVTVKEGAAYYKIGDALGSSTANKETLEGLYKSLVVKAKPIDGGSYETLPHGWHDGHNQQEGAFEYSIVAVGNDYLVVKVFHAEEHWSPLTMDLEADHGTKYGFKSEYMYQFDMVAGQLYDDEDECTGAYTALQTQENVVTVITRDDVPPTMIIADEKDTICGEDCNSYPVGTKANDGDDIEPCRNCVVSDGEISLVFSYPIVQTPYVGIDYDDFAWTSGDVNWWSETNLPLEQRHLLLANHANEYFEFYPVTRYEYVEGANPTVELAADPVELEYVTVEPDGKTIRIKPKYQLDSEGLYQIVFRGGTVKDTKRIPDGNVFMGDSCIFRAEEWIPVVVDSITHPVTAETVGNIYPLNESSIELTSNIDFSITFNQAVELNPTRTEPIVLRYMNGQKAEEFITTSQCSIIGRTLYIKHADLDDFESYYITVPDSFVMAVNACNALYNEAINPDEVGFSEWSFTTNDGTPPTALEYNPNDVRNDEGVITERTIDAPIDGILSIRFDENIDTINTCSDAGLFIYYNDGLDGFRDGIDFGNFVEFVPYADAIEITGSDPYDGLVSDVIKFDPELPFDRNGYYTIRATGSEDDWACGIIDLAGHPWAGIGDTITWSFTITNDVAPVLAGTTPSYTHPNGWDEEVCWEYTQYGSVKADLVMRFDDPEVRGEGDILIKGHDVENAGMDPDETPGHEIHIYEYVYDAESYDYYEKLWVSYDIFDEDHVIIAGDSVIIKDVVLRDEINGEAHYYVTVESGAIKNGLDGTTSYWTGIDDPFVWRFKTCTDDVFVDDTDAEDVIIYAPVGTELKNSWVFENESQVDTIRVSFSEGVEALNDAEGDVVVMDTDRNVEVARFTIEQSNIVNDSILCITGLDAFLLEDETNYNVTIEVGAIGDTSTVSTPNTVAISWDFHVGDNTLPEATILTDADCQSENIVLELQYKESKSVTLGAGNVYLTYNEGADTIWSETPVVGDLNTADSLTIVSVPFMNLPDTTVFAVVIENDFVKDGGVFTLSNDAVTHEAAITTADNTYPEAIVSIVENEGARIVDGVMQHANDVTIMVEFDEAVRALDGSVSFTNENETVTVAVADFDTENDSTFMYTLSGLEDETTYAFTMAGELFEDLNNACPDSANVWMGATEMSFVVGDNDSAMIVAYTPNNEIYGDYVELEAFTITVDDPTVVAGTGSITIFDAEDDSEVATFKTADIDMVAGDDNVVFSFVSGIEQYGTFYVTVDDDAFVDETATLLGAPVAGIAEGEWTFAVIDSIAPELEGWTPEDDGPKVATDTMLTMTFSEEVIDGDGFVYLYLHPDSLVATFDHYDEKVYEDSQWKVRYFLDGILLEESRYIVELDTNFVTDRAGNALADMPEDPIDEPTAWNFETLDETAPVVTLDGDDPLYGIEGYFLTITSDEAGKVYLIPDGYTGGVQSAVDAGVGFEAEINKDGGSVQISVAGLSGDYVAYGIDATGNISAPSTTKSVDKVDAVAIKDIVTSNENEYKYVLVDGEVTAVREAAGNRGFYLQDSRDINSGVFVLDEANDSELKRYETALLLAEVVYGVGAIEIKFISVNEFVADNFDVDPVQLESSASLNADYRDMLVKFHGYRGATTDAGTGQTKLWQTTEESIIVDDHLGYAKSDYSTETWYAVSGVVIESGGEFTVNPRDKNDVDELTPVEGLELGSYKVYPNPFVDYINVKVVSGKAVERVVLTNIAGQRIMDVTNNIDRIPTSELRSGVYFIQLHTEDGIAKTERIIKR